MITRQGGAIVPIPFEKMMDPKTGKTRVRLVDPTTDAHRSARSLQVRLERADLDDAGAPRRARQSDESLSRSDTRAVRGDRLGPLRADSRVARVVQSSRAWPSGA